MEGHPKAHILGADYIPREGIPHVGALRRVRLDLVQRDLKDILMGLAVAGHRGQCHILEVIPDTVFFQDLKNLE